MARYKLLDLISHGKIKARITLEAMQNGINIEDLQDQMFLRCELEEFETLKELKDSQLIKLLDSWPGPRTRYNVEDLIREIETTSPNRRIVLDVVESRNSVNRYEAEFYIEEEQKGEWIKKPSAIPGFVVANNKAERTIESEIERTVNFISKKYMHDLPFPSDKKFSPDKYVYNNFKIENVCRKNGKITADVTIDVQKEKDDLAWYENMHEYWQAIVAPVLLDPVMPKAYKKSYLQEFGKTLASEYPRLKGMPRLRRIHKSLYLIEDMLDIQEKKEDSFTKLNGNINTDDAELQEAQSIYAKNVLKSLVDSAEREKMHRHELAGNFAKGIPLKITLNTEIKYES